MTEDYADVEPTRAEVEALTGTTVLEFGSPFCGHCLRAQPLIAMAFAARPGLRHLKIADARGRRLGRSYGIKLWPTLIALRDGQEVARVVRPQDLDAVEATLRALDGEAARG